MSSDNQMSSDNGLNTKKVNSPSENSSPEEHGAGFVSRALFWTISTRYGGKFINLITTIILAWLLSKEDFARLASEQGRFRACRLCADFCCLYRDPGRIWGGVGMGLSQGRQGSVGQCLLDKCIHRLAYRLGCLSLRTNSGVDI